MAKHKEIISAIQDSCLRYVKPKKNSYLFVLFNALFAIQIPCKYESKSVQTKSVQEDVNDKFFKACI